MNNTNIETSPGSASDTLVKPRVALMGEFSAGKSTLLNLFLGCDPMPVRVTATRVPPIWVTYGSESAVRVCDDGTEEALAVESIPNVPVEGTRMVRLCVDADILRLCDLIDIPGISDPNMRHEEWADLMCDLDLVIWCTHATQAWRQSEAALWEEIAKSVEGPNYLAVTQFDKLKTDRDRARVLSRLDAETDGVFRAIFPIATLEAINAGVDEEAWKRSGGAAFVEELVSVMANWPNRVQASLESAEDENAPGDRFRKDAVASPSLKLAHSSEEDVHDHEVEETSMESPRRVSPKRVRPITRNPVRPDVSKPSLGETVGSDIGTRR